MFFLHQEMSDIERVSQLQVVPERSDSLSRTLFDNLSTICASGIGRMAVYCYGTVQKITFTERLILNRKAFLLSFLLSNSAENELRVGHALVFTSRFILSSAKRGLNLLRCLFSKRFFLNFV